MRILFIDIDTLRPDHLGCYGYHRNTSPNIDRIAEEGVKFENCYASDSPCLPSRSSLITGRFGIHTGVIGHGDTAADPFIEGKGRWFNSTLGNTSWAASLRKAGYKTVSISPFAERHSAWHWYAGFSEIHNTGGNGEESAEEIYPVVKQWLENNASGDNWFLHVNLWDPHTPYRAPEEYGNPFENDPLPAWYTEELRQQLWKGAGSWSAQEGLGYGGEHPYNDPGKYPRQPNKMESMEDVRKMFDNYDLGIKYADDYVGKIIGYLKAKGLYEDTAIIISSDHGENMGELNIHYDHQTADAITPHIPLIIKWKGLQAGLTDKALHYHFDYAATVLELAGGEVPPNWDGKSFASSLKENKEEGREYLVLSQGAHTCQRSVRFGDYICIHSYHDGFHNFPDTMLFNLAKDPHELKESAEKEPGTVGTAMKYLQEWHTEMMRTATHPQDPMWTVLKEGGPFHTILGMEGYINKLRKTGRGEQADLMLKKHPELKGKE